MSRIVKDALLGGTAAVFGLVCFFFYFILDKIIGLFGWGVVYPTRRQIVVYIILCIVLYPPACAWIRAGKK